MRYIFIILLIAAVYPANAQGKKEKQVKSAVEQLRMAMIDGDRKLLEQLADDKLSYGHSGGHVDDKKQFIEKIASGKSDFVSMELVDQTITISHKSAIVRHKLNAMTNDSGKPGEVHLLVMLVWLKKGGYWKLIGRQAVKAT